MLILVVDTNAVLFVEFFLSIKSKVPNDQYRAQYDFIFKTWAERSKAYVDSRKDFEYPPIEEPDKPDTYKEDQKH